MVFNLWSILLIASASQSLFLIVFFLNRPSKNRLAVNMMVVMLSVLLFIVISNLWYASRLYLEIPWLAGIGRGATLLLGPAFYLYTLAVVKPEFRLKPIQLLHLSGYLLSWLLILMQKRPEGIDTEMDAVEAFLLDGLPASPLVLSRFAIYGIHFLAYLYTSKKVVNESIRIGGAYSFAIESRGLWLKRLNYILAILAFGILAGLINAIATGIYSFELNFALTLGYSLFIYIIAYQALSNEKQVHPDFKLKYDGGIGDERKVEQTIEHLRKLLEQEKLYLNSDLKQADIASALKIPAHQLTKLLNSELNHSFFDFINEYRVRHFIELARTDEMKHLSIMGIAQESGFKSKSSFNTAFKKVTGRTPSEFLKGQ